MTGSVISSFDFGPRTEKVLTTKQKLAELQRRYEREAAPLLKALAEEWATEDASPASNRPVFIPLP